MKPSYLTFIALGLAMAQSGPALAHDNASVVYGVAADPIERTELSDGSRMARVNFADLDLTQPDDETALRKRVSTAAIYVCNAPLPDGYVLLGSNGGPLVCASATSREIKPKVDDLIAAARSGKQLAVTSFGMVSR